MNAEMIECLYHVARTETPGGIIVWITDATTMFAPWHDRRKRGRIRHARMSKGKHTQRAGKLRR